MISSTDMFKDRTDIQLYADRTKLLDAVECLLTGVITSLPSDPWNYLKDRIRQLQSSNGAYAWNMFVPDHVVLVRRIFPKGFGTLLDREEQQNQPTPEMYSIALQHYQNKLMIPCLKSLAIYRKLKIEQRHREQLEFSNAKTIYYKRLVATAFAGWLDWSRLVTQRMQKGVQILIRVDQTRLICAVFRAWAKDSKQTVEQKKWFNRIRRISTLMPEEGSDGEDPSFPEGEDHMSFLSRQSTVGNETFKSHAMDGQHAVTKILLYLDFKSLARCARVCRSWKVLTQNSALWRHIDLAVFSHKLSDKALISVMTKARPYLGHLNLRTCQSITKNSLKHVANCRNLQDLNLSEVTNISEEILATICQNCQGLLYLNVSYSNCNDIMLRAFSRYCVNLRYLSLAFCLEFTSQGLYNLSEGRGCHKLVYLDLSGCIQLTPDCMSSIGRAAPLLQTLLLTDVHTLIDDSLIALAVNCNRIQHLSLIGDESITDEGIKYFVVKNKDLRVFKIEDNRYITDVSIRALYRACVHLTHVHIANCPNITDQSLRVLAHLKNLQIINVADCINIGDPGVRQLSEGASKTKLRELTLTNCVWISDITLLRLSQNTSNLSYISFCYCDKVNDYGLEMLCNLPKLAGINLSGCNITDSGLSRLGEHSILRYLLLAECVHITDLGIEKLSSNCTKLYYLDISHCVLINDNAVKSIAFFCRFLDNLNLSYCPLLTDHSLDFISQGCPYLTNLNLASCSRISDRGCKSVRSGLVYLHRIDISYCANISQNALISLQKNISQVIHSENTHVYT